MTRDELFVAACSADSVSVRIPQKIAKEIGKALVDCLTQALKEGDEVNIVGIGKFFLVQRDAKVGHNPMTGAPIQIPAKRAVRFRASAPLKKTVA